MVDFKNPTISDIRWIKELSFSSGLRSTDYTFCSLFSWSGNYYSNVLARFKDRILIKMSIGGEVYYGYPVGRGELLPAVLALREDAVQNHIPFRMSNIPEELLPEVKGLFETEPKVTLDERFSEYVYPAEKLVTLSGKKLQSKRNHLYRFRDNNPTWSFEPISRENIAECKAFADFWFEKSAAEKDEDFEDEIHALNIVFDNYFDMELDGGLIRTSDGVIAFTIGEPVSEDTFICHFEKANPEINGSYTVINQQFAEYITKKYPNVVYINREEDMGIESLRKAKQSYHPAFLLNKYTVTWE